MAVSQLGELRFAFVVLSTERRARRRRMPFVWRRTIEASTAITFLYFFFM